MEAFNKLTPAEAERLTLISEECAEVIQAVSKIQRHGFDSTYPKTGETNREALERELGDLECVIQLAEKHKDVSTNNILAHKDAKRLKIDRYLHHNMVN